MANGCLRYNAKVAGLVEGVSAVTIHYREKCRFIGCSLFFLDFLHRTTNKETALRGMVVVEYSL